MFAFITIRLHGLLWCNQHVMNVYLEKEGNKIEDFASELCKTLKHQYSDDAPDAIGLSLELASPSTILTGSFFDFDDGTVMHVAWTQRNNR